MSDTYTANFTEIHEPGGTLFTDSRAIGTYNTAWLSMRDHQRAVFPLNVGEMAQGATLDMAIQQAQDVLGTGAKVFTPAKAITQLTAAAGDGDDLVIVEVRTEEMDVNGQFDWIRAQVIIAGGAVELALTPLRLASAYPPVPVTGWTEVVL